MGRTMLSGEDAGRTTPGVNIGSGACDASKFSSEPAIAGSDGSGANMGAMTGSAIGCETERATCQSGQKVCHQLTISR